MSGARQRWSATEYLVIAVLMLWSAVVVTAIIWWYE